MKLPYLIPILTIMLRSKCSFAWCNGASASICAGCYECGATVRPTFIIQHAISNTSSVVKIILQRRRRIWAREIVINIVVVVKIVVVTRIGKFLFLIVLSYVMKEEVARSLNEKVGKILSIFDQPSTSKKTFNDLELSPEGKSSACEGMRNENVSNDKNDAEKARDVKHKNSLKKGKREHPDSSDIEEGRKVPKKSLKLDITSSESEFQDDSLSELQSDSDNEKDENLKSVSHKRELKRKYERKREQEREEREREREREEREQEFRSDDEESEQEFRSDDEENLLGDDNRENNERQIAASRDRERERNYQANRRRERDQERINQANRRRERGQERINLIPRVCERRDHAGRVMLPLRNRNKGPVDIAAALNPVTLTRRAFQVRVMDLLQNFFAVSWYPILKLPVLSLIQWALGPIL
ncbi:unnamed protein product [Trichogramma brassicae]|uniref:Uncharacterized protein n=1 Tax=Trichogramma brassicae TaxID=86971 RepID=A0A6H5I692_9HYME|nr:unnamed protein product [Trichogramma brassicae]